MAWVSNQMTFEDLVVGPSNQSSHYRPFKMNEKCFVRPDHECGKVFEALKSCFIACPSDESLEPMLALISEKLQKSQVEPIIAVKERAYGKDIFCTKICGKIIESKFCMTILDDTIKNGVNVPNPNIYFEYGLMTALKKYIIPLQKDELTLAFNIRSHDTIKYKAGNLAVELDRAIRDAILFTADDEKKDLKIPTNSISTKGIIRDFEIAEFKPKDREWFLNHAISDTKFRGFGNDEKEFYLYLGVLDSQQDCETYLDDISIVLYRTEKEYNLLLERETEIKDSLPKNEQALSSVSVTSIQGRRLIDSLSRNKEKLEDIQGKLNNLKILYIGFINRANLDLKEFEKNCNKIIAGNPRASLVISDVDKMQSGEVIVNLKAFKSST